MFAGGIGVLALLIVAALCGPGAMAQQAQQNQHTDRPEPQQQPQPLPAAPSHINPPTSAAPAPTLEEEIAIIDDLEKRGVMGSEIANEQRAYYRRKAAGVQSGALPERQPGAAEIPPGAVADEHRRATNAPQTQSVPPSPQDSQPQPPLPAATNPAAAPAPSLPPELPPEYGPATVEEMGFWSTVFAFFTFSNLVWIAASALLVVAIFWLAGVYLVALLLLVPVPVYEAVLYGTCLTLMMYAANWPHEWAGLVALPGCMGLLPTAMFSHWRHKRELSVYFQQHDIDRVAFTSGWLGAIWGAAAAVHQSAMLGSMCAVAAIVAFFASNRVRAMCRALAPLGGWIRRPVLVETALGGATPVTVTVDDGGASTMALGVLITKILTAGLGCFLLLPLLFVLETTNLVFLPAAYMGAMLGWIIPVLQLSSPRVAPLVRAKSGRWRVIAAVSGLAALLFGLLAGYDLATRTGATMLLIFAFLQMADALARREESDAWTALAYGVSFLVAALLLGFFPEAWLTYWLTPGVQVQLKYLGYLLVGGALVYQSTRDPGNEKDVRRFLHSQLLVVACVALLAFSPSILGPWLEAIFPIDTTVPPGDEPWYLHDTRKFSGSLLALYLVVQFIDLRRSGRSWPWVALGLAGMLYGISLLARAYPAYFWLSTAGT